ncbi:MAG: hypothetical protein DMF85_01390 [Acidobacteria bacterium]|nr:MAG: hypothetical protein DMF85_01390 [Acidobacteriota bacterium]
MGAKVLVYTTYADGGRMTPSVTARHELLIAIAELRRGIDTFNLRVPVSVEFARVVHAAAMARPDADDVSRALAGLVRKLEAGGAAVRNTSILFNPIARIASVLGVSLTALGISLRSLRPRVRLIPAPPSRGTPTHAKAQGAPRNANQKGLLCVLCVPA